MLRFALYLVGLQTVVSTTSPTTAAPTRPPTPFIVPRLPISKTGRRYPSCKAEVIFAIDVSGSVALPNQDLMFTFVDYMITEAERNLEDARYGVVVFGIPGTTANAKTFDGSNGVTVSMPPPYGNALPAATEVFLSLDHLRYGCAECNVVTSRANYTGNFSQLEMLNSVKYSGGLTPTWDAIDFARQQFAQRGDPTVPGRFIVLLTDGVPNDGNCLPNDNVTTAPGCIRTVNLTNNAIAAAKAEGALIITIGFQLTRPTQDLLIQWTSEPRDVLSIVGDYTTLTTLVPKLLQIMCPLTEGLPCLDDGSTAVDIRGSGFLNTGVLRCRFTAQGKNFQPEHETQGQFVNSELIRCPFPQTGFSPGGWIVSYTQDGRGYSLGTTFKFGGCSGNNSGSKPDSMVALFMAGIALVWSIV